MKQVRIVVSCLPVLLFLNAYAQIKVYLVVYNAKIYTVDSNFSIAEAMAIRGDRIIAVGSTNSIKANYSTKNLFDAHGKFIYPGFIDAHTHFYRYGLGLQTANLTGTTSWDEAVSTLQQF